MALGAAARRSVSERPQLAAEERPGVVHRRLTPVDPVRQRLDVGALQIAAVRVDLDRRRRRRPRSRSPLRTSARKSIGRYAAAPSMASCSTSRSMRALLSSELSTRCWPRPDAIEHADRLDAPQDVRVDRPGRHLERVRVEELHGLRLLVARRSA